MERLKTIKFTATLWVCEWYDHENDTWWKSASEIVAKVWQKMAEKVFQNDGIYVSAWVTDSTMVYSTNRWCPEWWEKVVEISGTRNPKFCTDVEKWKQAVIDVLMLSKDELKQTTAQVEFSEVEMAYLN